MKKLLVLLAIALFLLAGCTEEPPIQTTQATEPVETTVATTPDPGLYDPNSEVEAATGGALRSYPLGCDSGIGIAVMGEDILLLTSSQTGTTLTLLEGENCVRKAEITVAAPLYPDSGSFWCSEDGVVYYDSYSCCVVRLDENLKETDRVSMPANMRGEPVIAPNGTDVYYCTQESVHALSLDTGISRLVRQQECMWQAVRQVVCGGDVLEWFVIDNDGSSYVGYLSTDTGELMGKDAYVFSLKSWEQRYILQRTEGYLDEVLFDMGSGQQTLCLDMQETLYGLPEVGGALTVQEDRLAWYDLETGYKTGCVTLGENANVYSVAAEGGYLWLLCYHSGSDEDVLYRWEPESSPTGDDTVYTAPRYTEENPDTQGLAQLQAQADALGEQYGVRIALSADVKQPWDYTLTYEYRVDTLRYALEALELGLRAYPEGFLKTAVEQTDCQTLCISLVRDISGDVDGLQYWVESDAFIAVEISDTVHQTLYHEVSHVLDNFIIARSYAYDDWEELNPAGVEYDYNYNEYQNRQDLFWTMGENRAFIDSYSMSYPKEDRARILEYAMIPGNEELFSSQAMQGKLLRICQGIRECFGYEKYQGEFLWEQYLQESLAYTG